MLIAIDAGHGGGDKGGQSLGPPESKLALQYALEFDSVLEKAGIGTILIRKADVFIPLSERASIANAAGADLFVSFHANASSNAKARGPWTLYAKGSKKGKRMAEVVQLALTEVLGGHRTAFYSDASDYTGYTDKAAQVAEAAKIVGQDVKSALKSAGITEPYRTLAVLRQTKMPAVLIELGFMTNLNDIQLLQDVMVRKRVCANVARAILRELRLPVDKIVVPSMAVPVGPKPKVNLEKIPVPTRDHVAEAVEQAGTDRMSVEKGLQIAETILKGVAAAKSGDVKNILEFLRKTFAEYRG